MKMIYERERSFRRAGEKPWPSRTRRAAVAALALFLTGMVYAGTTAPTGVPDPALATLPLEDVLNLYRENEKSRETAPPMPPVEAAVHRIELDARLLDTAVSSHARFQGMVLTEDRWVSVPLLAVGPKTLLSELPTFKDSVLTVIDGYLTLVTRRRGEFDFEIEFLQRAAVEGQTRRALVTYPAATFATGRLSYDKGLFQLIDGSSGMGADGVVFPEAGVFDLNWLRVPDATPAPTTTHAIPAIESVIPSAHASVVSTLEGTHILRVLYRLRFAGRKQLQIDIPSGQRLERGYLNGVSIPVADAGGTLSLDVFPSQAGEEGGSLELVMFIPSDGYLLSGELSLALPKTSWRINELFVSAHLPRVFDYAWVAGTLSRTENVPRTHFSYDIPTPGKQLNFHQFLVHTSQPTLTLGYDVALEGSYFRASP